MKRRNAAISLVSIAMLPAPALAHPGHGGSLVAGMLHPLSGADHLAAMLLVGLCATHIRKRAWLLPLAFMTGLAAGFMTGAQFLSGGFAEATILASVIALGLAAMLRTVVPTLLAVTGVTAFGFAHGAAHAMELPHSATPYLFAVGFLASSAALHFGGYWLSRKLPVPALRLIGAAGVGLGLFLAGAS